MPTIFSLYLVTPWIYDYFILNANKINEKLNIVKFLMSSYIIFPRESQIFLYCNKRHIIRFIISIILLNW